MKKISSKTKNPNKIKMMTNQEAEKMINSKIVFVEKLIRKVKASQECFAELQTGSFLQITNSMQSFL
jgi:uncharacterized membrane protein